MKGLLENISKKLGLTKTELYTLIFSLLVFVIGIVQKNLKFEDFELKQAKFDYSYQDSLFKAVQREKNKITLSENHLEKRVDSDSELSDFSNKKKDSKKNSSKTLPEKSININTADVSLLSRLPGIGSKTAKKIVIYRKNNGYFKSLDELLKVKGIAEKKFNKIKKYIFIEN